MIKTLDLKKERKERKKERKKQHIVKSGWFSS
jgi:hypothetical protein